MKLANVKLGNVWSYKELIDGREKFKILTKSLMAEFNLDYY